MQPMAIEPMPVASLRPHPGNARTHSKKQIRQIADSIRQFGFNNPVLIGEDGGIIAGHGRVEAAKLLGCPHLAKPVASENSVHLTRGQPLCLSAQGSRWDLLGLHYLNVLPPNGGGRLTQSECQLGQLQIVCC
jgi:hypothetical protein